MMVFKNSSAIGDAGVLMPLSPHQIRLIESFSADMYQKLDSTHGLKHGQRTARLAMYLAQIELADEEICRLGALLHQFHSNGAETVDTFLREIDVDEEVRWNLVHCVECIDPETIGKAETIEAKVVFDADKLQTLGPYGLVREVAYRTGHLGVDFSTALVQTRELQAKMHGLIQTTAGRELADLIFEPMNLIFSLVLDWDKLGFLPD